MQFDKMGIYRKRERHFVLAFKSLRGRMSRCRIRYVFDYEKTDPRIFVNCFIDSNGANSQKGAQSDSLIQVSINVLN